MILCIIWKRIWWDINYDGKRKKNRWNDKLPTSRKHHNIWTKSSKNPTKGSHIRQSEEYFISMLVSFNKFSTYNKKTIQLEHKYSKNTQKRLHKVIVPTESPGRVNTTVEHTTERHETRSRKCSTTKLTPNIWHGLNHG